MRARSVRLGHRSHRYGRLRRNSNLGRGHVRHHYFFSFRGWRHLRLLIPNPPETAETATDHDSDDDPDPPHRHGVAGGVPEAVVTKAVVTKGSTTGVMAATRFHHTVAAAVAIAITRRAVIHMAIPLVACAYCIHGDAKVFAVAAATCAGETAITGAALGTHVVVIATKSLGA